jgi:hypothetical protein
MERTIEIVKQYEQGDSYERICLFLQYLDLRDVFLDIDLKNYTVDNGVLSSSGITCRLQRILHW